MTLMSLLASKTNSRVAFSSAMAIKRSGKEGNRRLVFATKLVVKVNAPPRRGFCISGMQRRWNEMDDLFQLAQLALIVVFGVGLLVAGQLFIRR